MEPISHSGESLTKRCGTCETVKSAAEFSKDRSRPDGLFTRCKSCDKERARKKCRENPDFVERERIRKVQWRRDNPDYARAYRSANPDKMKQWHAKHPLYNKLNMGRLRAERAGAEAHDITEQELLTYWRRSVGIDPHVCFYTGASLRNIDWHIDHKTPISRGGGHTLDNLVPCTPLANSMKGTQTAEEFVVPVNARIIDDDRYDVVNGEKRYTVERMADGSWCVTNHRKRVIKQGTEVHRRIVAAIAILS